MNNILNVKIYSCALGDVNKKMEFNALQDNLGLSSFSTPADSNFEKMIVEVSTLDEFKSKFENPIGIIKIDVQGFEINVLKGAKNIIIENKPYIILEQEDCLSNNLEYIKKIKSEMKEYFKKYNYSVFYISKYDPMMLFPVQWEKLLNGDLLALPN